MPGTCSSGTGEMIIDRVNDKVKWQKQSTLFRISYRPEGIFRELPYLWQVKGVLRELRLRPCHLRWLLLGSFWGHEGALPEGTGAICRCNVF